MAKLIYLSSLPYLELLYLSWNSETKILNVLLKNLMRVENFEICVLKLINIYRKLID